MEERILIIDDDADYIEVLRHKLQQIGYPDVKAEVQSRKAAERFRQGADYDLALIDMTMPEMSGVELLGVIKTVSPNTECLMVTAINEARVAVECLRKGAYDYLVKPVTKEALALAVQRALERKRLRDILDMEKRDTPPPITAKAPFRPIITRSRTMLRVLMEAELHAASDVPVLITGESGTGKELLARAIHKASPRAQNPFTPVNMASLTPTLFEAEFFGHTRGAFTGAESQRSGYLRHTDKGTLFLDEIGDLPLELQGKLLRVLQEGEYTRLGSSQQIQVDIRFIAATNANLEQMLAQQRFRQDLYYRIRGSWLHLPPLRERREDIPLLAKTFLARYEAGHGENPLTPAALAALQRYDFPGNVRELATLLHSAANLAQGRPIAIRHLPEHLRSLQVSEEVDQPSPRPVREDGGRPLRPLAEIEKAYILEAYARLGKNKAKTAKTLEIGINTLRRKLQRYGVD
ncbi:MAG: sigma-54 dependent transcriptional regulator [Desulfosarcinaceae bacterium]|nr:sigma-54 dependent transcriptional regulator [Desulfosarcinaceae bacterium]